MHSEFYKNKFDTKKERAPTVMHVPLHYTINQKRLCQSVPLPHLLRLTFGSGESGG